MALTEAQLQAKITAIDAEIDAIVAGNPSGSLVNYSVGSHQFNKTSRLAELRSQRQQYQDLMEAIPAEETTIYDDPDL